MEKPLTQHPEQKWGHKGPGEAIVLPAWLPGQPLSCLLPGLPGALLTFSPFQSVGYKFGGTLSSCLGYLMTEFLPQTFRYLFLDAKPLPHFSLLCARVRVPSLHFSPSLRLISILCLLQFIHPGQSCPQPFYERSPLHHTFTPLLCSFLLP